MSLSWPGGPPGRAGAVAARGAGAVPGSTSTAHKGEGRREHTPLGHTPASVLQRVQHTVPHAKGQSVNVTSDSQTLCGQRERRRLLTESLT